MSPISVLLAEDHVVMREGVCALLETGGEFKVVGQAETGMEAVALAAKLRPDVVVMDIAMPGLNGCEATRQIVAQNPAARVLVLSAHSDDEYVVRMVTVGALGFVEKQAPGALLFRAIREVASGKVFFSPGITRLLLRNQRRARERGPDAGSLHDSLTSREEEVLQLVAEGAANKQIAARLGVSIKTVEKHRQQLMNKLDIHETAGLTRYAIASGTIEANGKAGHF
jgi:DNA-binding NarL/FixJ family response regulator